MSSNITMSLMSAMEFLLSTALAWLFWKRRLHHRFPATATYLALRVVSTPVLFLLLSGNLVAQWQMWSVAYFFAYWAVYIASAIIIFFICMEVFKSALAAFSGLRRFGVVIFRWTAFASVIVSFSTVHNWHHGVLLSTDIAYALMRAVSILELCLLAFLCLSMNALQLSVRDVAFGLSLGFGLLSSSDFMMASLMSWSTPLTANVQFIYQTLILLALGIWIIYAVVPEPARKPVVVSPNSTIYRWNEIASALGYTGTRIAVQQPANSAFLADVDTVAQKAMSRSLQERESDS